jgi:hypothetical protein
MVKIDVVIKGPHKVMVSLVVMDHKVLRDPKDHQDHRVLMVKTVRPDLLALLVQLDPKDQQDRKELMVKTVRLDLLGLLVQ